MHEQYLCRRSGEIGYKRCRDYADAVPFWTFIAAPLDTPRVDLDGARRDRSRKADPTRRFATSGS